MPLTLEGVLGEPSPRDVRNSTLGAADRKKPRLLMLRATESSGRLKGFGAEFEDFGFPEVEVAVTGLAPGADDVDRHVAIEGTVTARAGRFGCYVVTPSRVLWQDVGFEASRDGCNAYLHEVSDWLMGDEARCDAIGETMTLPGSVADPVPPRLDVRVDTLYDDRDDERLETLQATLRGCGLEVRVLGRDEGPWGDYDWVRTVRATVPGGHVRGPVPTMPAGRPASHRAVPIPGGGPEWDPDVIARRKRDHEEFTVRNDALVASLFGPAMGVA